jgi:methionyl-tRNA formyltransferase
LIRWEHDAVTIKNLVRGLNPKPGAYTRWQGKLLKVHRAAVVAGNGRPPVPPGTIMAADKRLVVSCGQGGALELREVQLEGKKRLSIEEFLRGNGPTKGERLGA